MTDISGLDATGQAEALPSGTVGLEHDDRVRGIHARIPSRDGAIFGYEQKNRFGARSHQKCAGGIKYGPGGCCRPGAVRGSNLDYKRLG